MLEIDRLYYILQLYYKSYCTTNYKPMSCELYQNGCKIGIERNCQLMSHRQNLNGDLFASCHGDSTCSYPCSAL